MNHHASRSSPPPNPDMKFITMKQSILPRSVLRCLIPGLALVTPSVAAGNTSTNSQEESGLAADRSLPSALRTGAARRLAIDLRTGKVFGSRTVADGCIVQRFSSETALRAGAGPEAVFRLAAPAAAATAAAGWAGENPDNSGPAHPPVVICDGDGRLWVADASHHRVLRYDGAADLPSGALPGGILGQADFHGSAPGASASRMHAPADIALDGHGRLYVADTGNARILWFNDAARRGPGASANGVIGQTDFDSRGPGGVALRQPARLALEGGGRGMPATLWVADAAARHVLRFDNATALPLTGARASAVFVSGKWLQSDQ